jgi:erythromycin esterase
LDIAGDIAKVETQYRLAGTYSAQGPPKPMRGTIDTTDQWTLQDGRWKLTQTSVHAIVSYVDGKKMEDDREERMPSDAAIDELHQRGIAVPSLQLDEDPKQLAAVGAAIGNARIVGMGEGTHGSSEFFAFKNRLFKYLVEQKGFTVFAIEAAWGGGMAVDRYVKGGPGTAEQAVASLEFWTWNTPEVLDLVRWMRAYNAAPGPHATLSFAGFDMQNPIAPANYVRDFLSQHGDAPQAQSALECVAPLVVAKTLGKKDAAGPKACRQKVAALSAPIAAAQTAPDVSTAQEALTNVLQYLDAYAGTAMYVARDRDMAANVEWLASVKDPSQKIALWAHNGHIAVRGTDASYPTMGSFLRTKFGANYYAIGQTFSSGTVRGVVTKQGLQAVTVPARANDSIAALFAPLGGVGFLDLRSLPAGSSLAAYFQGQHRIADIGAVLDPDDLSDVSTPMIVPSVFDGLVYVPKSTAATNGVEITQMRRDVPQDGVPWVVTGAGFNDVTVSAIADGASLHSVDAFNEMPDALLRRFDASAYAGQTIRISGEVQRTGTLGFAYPIAETVDANGSLGRPAWGAYVDSRAAATWVPFTTSTLVVPKGARYLEAGVSSTGTGLTELRNVTVQVVPAKATAAPHG